MSKRSLGVTDLEHNDKRTKNNKLSNDEEKLTHMYFLWNSKYPGSSFALAKPVKSNWNLKLISFNINGIRAALKNGVFASIKEEDADIIGFQETKCSTSKIPMECKMSGYKHFFSCGQKEGYAGTALFSRTSPLQLRYGIGKQKHDTEGRVMTAEFEKFYFVNAYVPNSGQGLVRLPYREKEWDPDFLEYLKDLDSKKPLIVAGDLNVAHQEIDLSNPSTNRKTSGFTDQERAGFTTLLKSVNLIDTYRNLYPERNNAYTFWSYRQSARKNNVGWRLDYFLVSERLLPNICDHEIRCAVSGSDHCPIVLYMNI